jgi:hypothetical protein
MGGVAVSTRTHPPRLRNVPSTKGEQKVQALDIIEVAVLYGVTLLWVIYYACSRPWVFYPLLRSVAYALMLILLA